MSSTETQKNVVATPEQFKQLVNAAAERRTATLQAEVSQLRIEIQAIRNGRINETRGLGSIAPARIPTRQDLAEFAQVKIEATPLNEIIDAISAETGKPVKALIGEVRSP